MRKLLIPLLMGLAVTLQAASGTAITNTSIGASLGGTEILTNKTLLAPVMTNTVRLAKNLGGAYLVSDEDHRLHLSVGVTLTNSAWIAGSDYGGSIWSFDGDQLDVWQTNSSAIGAQNITTAKTMRMKSGVITAKRFHLRGITDWYAFGDSYTANNQYQPLMTADMLVTTHNLGISGNQVAEYIDPAYTNQVSTSQISTILFGVNDMRARGTDAAKQQNSEESLQAMVTWLAIPDAKKYRASTCTLAGTWAANGLYGLTTGRSSSTPGDTITSTVGGSTIFVGASRTNSGGGLFSVTVDGVCFGNYNCSNATATLYGRTYNPFLVRIPNLLNGSHTVVISNVTGTVNIDWLAGNYRYSDFESGPHVIVGDVCRDTADGYALYAPNNQGSDTAVYQFNERVARVCKQAAMDGLSVRRARVSENFNPLTMIGPDQVHPNADGYAAIAAAFRREMSFTASPEVKGQAEVLNGDGSTPITFGTHPYTITIDPAGFQTVGSHTVRYHCTGCTKVGSTFRALQTTATIITQQGDEIWLFANSGLTIGATFSPTKIATFSASGMSIYVPGEGLKAVTVGASDSGGTGYKLLRVPN